MWRILLVLLIFIAMVLVGTAEASDDPPDYVLDQIIRWVPLVRRWNSLETIEGEPNPIYQMDEALVLAVIAEESIGYPQLISCVGAVGLMQVIPGTHVVPAPASVAPYPGAAVWWHCPEPHRSIAIGSRPAWQKLLSPANNIWFGMRILAHAIRNAQGNVWVGLAYYNCGEKSYDAGKCHHLGGDVYAEHVLEYWVPAIREALGDDYISQILEAYRPEYRNSLQIR